MTTNILKAIMNIRKRGDNSLLNIYVIPKINPSAVNRANNVGEALEFYMRDAFCDTFSEKNAQKKKEAYSKNFSYLGNQNNPPDIIIKESDAIEVKKIAGLNGTDLALNSSYPKSKLFADSPLITQACKDCEKGWKEKDMLYAVGFVEKDKLKLLILVYGDCYAADPKIYEKVKETVVQELGKSALEFSETNEIGRVNRVDPLGITNLRIRGMWTIQNPLRVFSDIFSYKKGIDEFTLITLMKKSKYLSMSKEDRVAIEKDKYFKLKDVKISDPNNPAKQLEAKLIVHTQK
jgi:hypothetical protein